MQPDLSDLLQKLCQGTEQTLSNGQGEVWHLDAALLAATNPGKPVQPNHIFISNTIRHACHLTYNSTHAGWDNAVNSLAAESCKELGLTTTAHVKARLQQVSLVSDRRSYSFDPKAEIPPGTFATMVVLLLPPGMVRSIVKLPRCVELLLAANQVCSGAISKCCLQEIQATIQQDSKQELVCRCKDSCLGCMAYFTGMRLFCACFCEWRRCVGECLLLQKLMPEYKS